MVFVQDGVYSMTIQSSQIKLMIIMHQAFLISYAPEPVKVLIASSNLIMCFTNSFSMCTQGEIGLFIKKTVSISSR